MREWSPPDREVSMKSWRECSKERNVEREEITEVGMWEFNSDLGHVDSCITLKNISIKYAVLTLSAYEQSIILEIVYVEGVRQSACTQETCITLGGGEIKFIF